MVCAEAESSGVTRFPSPPGPSPKAGEGEKELQLRSPALGEGPGVRGEGKTRGTTHERKDNRRLSPPDGRTRRGARTMAPPQAPRRRYLDAGRDARRAGALGCGR